MVNSQKLTIEEMQELAKEKGGKCLSKKYYNNHTKLKWQCKEGHIWEAMPGGIKSGKWCRICSYKIIANSLKGNLKDLKNLAKERGGKCLSKKYVNSKTKLKWQCKNEHKWWAVPGSLSMGTWCPYCAGLVKHTLEEMQKIARERGGKCLSKEYIDNKTLLEWQCKNGHRWKAVFKSINRGSWCPYCIGKNQTIKDMGKLAKERGGRCLSKKYYNNHTKLLWQCKEGHIWKAYSQAIKEDVWCPTCSSGKISEKICRRFFEEIFQQKFPSTRLNWLRTPKGTMLELDGYCKNLNLAFEYQGKQHYEHIKLFHTKNRFQENLQRDKLKRRLCKKNKVILIEIPYTVTYEQMADHIQKECANKGIIITKAKRIINYKTFNISSLDLLKELQKLTREKGGKCLSKRYINSGSKLLFQCKTGHKWLATPTKIKYGRWCPYCAGNIRLTIKDVQKLAREKGGKCLSKRYINNRTKLFWQCKKNHVWKTNPTHIQRGHWCPYCAGNIRLTIKDVQKLAKKMGGKCLSKKYINSGSKLLLQCKKGHKWFGIYDNIKAGHWCPYCVGVGKHTLKEMQKIAKERGGKCLSKIYVNSKFKLLWQCKEGHKWWATPSSHWCPKCGIEKMKAKQRGSIPEMQLIAKKKGGKCLSKEYINNNTKLLWQCKEGHKWEAISNNIKKGTWCPYCN